MVSVGGERVIEKSCGSTVIDRLGAVDGLKIEAVCGAKLAAISWTPGVRSERAKESVPPAAAGWVVSSTGAPGLVTSVKVMVPTGVWEVPGAVTFERSVKLWVGRMELTEAVRVSAVGAGSR